MWGGFVFVFLLVIPGIITYAAGWRFDLGQRWFVRTSTLIIASYPNEAKVIIEGERTDHAPGWNKFLSPGRRHITVRGRNSSLWEKTLELLPGEVTFAEHVILFSPREPVYLKNASQSSPRRAMADSRELSEGGTRLVGREYRQPGGDLILRQASPYELTLLDPKTNQEELLQRRSNPITRAEWFPPLPGLPEKSGWVIFADRNEVTALEIDGRDQRNMTLLVTAQRLDDFAVTRDGRELLLAGRVKNREGIFSLPLFYNSTTE